MRRTYIILLMFLVVVPVANGWIWVDQSDATDNNICLDCNGDVVWRLTANQSIRLKNITVDIFSNTASGGSDAVELSIYGENATNMPDLSNKICAKNFTASSAGTGTETITGLTCNLVSSTSYWFSAEHYFDSGDITMYQDNNGGYSSTVFNGNARRDKPNFYDDEFSTQAYPNVIFYVEDSLSISNINVTSCYVNQTAWNDDVNAITRCRTSTPTTTLDTSEPTNVTVCVGLDKDKNYSAMKADPECSQCTTEDVTSHSCTVSGTALREFNNTVYYSTQASQNGTATKGPFSIYLDGHINGTVTVSDTPQANATIFALDIGTNETMDVDVSDVSGLWDLWLQFEGNFSATAILNGSIQGWSQTHQPLAHCCYEITQQRNVT